MIGTKWTREGRGKIEMHRRKDTLAGSRRVP